MKAPPAHRTLLVLAALLAVGGSVFAGIAGMTDRDALSGVGLSVLLVVAALVTRTVGRAWILAVTATMGGMLVTLLAGLHHAHAAVRWTRVEESLERNIAVGTAIAIAGICVVGAVVVWRGLPRDAEDGAPAAAVPGPVGNGRAPGFRAHGRRLATGCGAILIALGFCAIKVTTLPRIAVASLSDPTTSPLLDDPVVQQVLTDPRILHRLRTQPDFRQKVRRLGVPPALIRFALDIAEREFGSLPEVPHHPPALRRQDRMGGPLTSAQQLIDDARRRPAPPRGTAAPQRVAPPRIHAPESAPRRVDDADGAPKAAPPGRVFVPDLSEEDLVPTVEATTETTAVASAPTTAPTTAMNTAEALPDPEAAAFVDEEAGATTDEDAAVELVRQAVASAVPGETLVDTAARRTDFWGTVAIAVGGLTMILGLALGWGPVRRP